MDNHLAAIWCWSQAINFKKKYSLLHIDAHDDLSKTYSHEAYEYLKKNKIKVQDIPIENLTSLKLKLSDGRICQLFVWDNYINVFNLTNPGLLKDVVFSTSEFEKKISSRLKIKRIENFYLQDNLLEILQQSEHKWIVNLDIDYFFTENNGQTYQYLTDTFIYNITNQLKIALQENMIEVLTIAISPECCGNWETALRVINLVSHHLGTKFNYQ